MWPLIIAGFIVLIVLMLVSVSYRWNASPAGPSPHGEDQLTRGANGEIHYSARAARGPTWWGRNLGFQRPIGLLLIVGGLWHAASPWINRYSDVHAAVVSDVASGLALAAVGAVFVAVRGGALLTAAAAIIGVWVLIAPQVLGFGGPGLAAHEAVWGGPITIVLAALAALERALGRDNGLAPVGTQS
jgi:hypothetical protein